MKLGEGGLNILNKGFFFENSLRLDICRISNIYFTVQGLTRPSSNSLARGRKSI
jgi:hypothetical protein